MGDGPSYMNDLLVLNSGINGRIQGSYPFLDKKFKVFSRTHFPFFPRTTFSAKKSLASVFFDSFTT